MPEISIIVRTKNEERWISHCLRTIFEQDFEDFEVIIVDNNSTDHTVKVAKRYPVSKILNIDKFFPGKALNIGINASTGKYIACISAHCIPKDRNWLKKLHNNFKNSSELAGVYGGQLPVAYTSDADKRDLLITFGRDKRTQIKDYFFHNANSLIPKEILMKFPFDDDLTNIEDRVWAKQVIKAGYHIIYDPDAAVYHYHGLHQHTDNSSRVKGIATILDKVDSDISGDLPESLKPENINVAAILLVNEEAPEGSFEKKLISIAVKELKKSLFVNKIYILCKDKNIALSIDIDWIDRTKRKFSNNSLNIEKLLSLTLEEIETTSFYPETLLYVNHHYPFRPNDIFDNLIMEAQYKGFNSVFPCFEDYGHYWQNSLENGVNQIDASMESRNKRSPIMRALYGLGCATSSVEIRQGNIVGGKIGIIPIDNYKFTLNSREIGSKEIIEKILKN
jgi:glycosyltransferase involved in cell wall biosynthesis